MQSTFSIQKKNLKYFSNCVFAQCSKNISLYKSNLDLVQTFIIILIVWGFSKTCGFKSSVFVHLSGSKHSRYSPPVLTVKRLFKAKNTGLTPVYISGFEIEGQPCEGHGFKVLNCDPFTVEPAQSIDVDIAFTPDFTLSKVTRTLTLQTSLSPEKRQINFTLQATDPPHMLFVCASVLPRPSW